MLDKRKILETKRFIKQNERRRLIYVAEQKKFRKKKQALRKSNKYNIKGKKKSNLNNLQGPKSKMETSNDYVD